eukprot:4789764-Amphidinium_carterae.1
MVQRKYEVHSKPEKQHPHTEIHIISYYDIDPSGAKMSATATVLSRSEVFCDIHCILVAVLDSDNLA